MTRTASEIFREASGYDDREEASDEEIERSFTRMDNLIKNFHSPHPLDETGRPIPPPPDLTPKVDSSKIRKRKQKGKHAKRR